jgi:hypothetical protein
MCGECNEDSVLVVMATPGGPAWLPRKNRTRYFIAGTYLAGAVNTGFDVSIVRVFRPFARRREAEFVLTPGALSYATCRVVADAPLNWSTSTAEYIAPPSTMTLKTPGGKGVEITSESIAPYVPKGGIEGVVPVPAEDPALS